jgi:hypothetical protein
LPDFDFRNNIRITLPTKYHGIVSLSRAKWQEICQEPERFYYKDNAEKVSTTLINPDYVRHSSNHEN